MESIILLLIDHRSYSNELKQKQKQKQNLPAPDTRHIPRLQTNKLFFDIIYRNLIDFSS